MAVASSEPALTGDDSSALAVARATLSGLAAPRRALPILLVATPLLVEQAQPGQPRSIFVGALLCVACAVLAPTSWRVIVGAHASATRLLLYGALGAAVVGAIGVGLPALLHLRASFLTAPLSVVISLALYWVAGWGLGRDLELEARLAAERERAAALAREAERAQLLALRAHLDPHFVFNTLNAIAEWCRVDGAIAEQAILRLAGMLRTILAGAQSEWWPIAREVELVEALFELYRLRDPSRFRVVGELDPTAAGAPIPPLLLLLLAENAIKHGPARGFDGEVRYVIRRATSEPGGSSLHVSISNPGPYTGPRPGSDGLPTVEQRLALAYGGRARFTIAAAGDRTAVELELPDPAEVAR